MPSDEGSERIGRLYGQALANFDTVGEFELALSNATASRSYNWTAEELAEVLERFVAAEVSANPPSRNAAYRRLRQEARNAE